MLFDIIAALAIIIAIEFASLQGEKMRLQEHFTRKITRKNPLPELGLEPTRFQLVYLLART